MDTEQQDIVDASQTEGYGDSRETLPNGWAWTTLNAISDINPRMTWNDYFTEDMPVTFVPMAAVDDVSGTILDFQTRNITEVWKGYTRFAEGDVLFAKITPCMENGKAAIAHSLQNGLGFGSTEFHVLRATEVVISKWLYYYIRQQSFRDAAVRSMTGTAGQLRVPSKYLVESVIPLAPLNEQKRIVEVIEAQFTRLDAGVAALKRLQANLKRYKAAVLKAACEGRLVAQDASDEPANVLLERILAERREKWAAEQWAKGKYPRKQMYEEPAAPDVDGLPELPEGWVWATVQQLTLSIRSGTAAVPQDTATNTSILRSSSVRPFTIDYADVRYLEDVIEEANFLRSGNLLFTRLNGNLEYVGNCAQVKVDVHDVAYPDRLFCAVPVDIETGAYVEIYFNSPFIRSRIENVAKSTAGHQRISQGDVLFQPIALPPKNVQSKIVNEVQRSFSMANDLISTMELAIRRSERLRQAILREAFAGRLVAQDANDEPASVLLERIQGKRNKK